MNIEKIRLSNYRNFKEYSIGFGKETTIFIGKNGMGKTNLISAIAHSLSFIFSKKKDEIQYEFIASSDENIKSFAATDNRYSYDGNKGDYDYPLSIKTFVTIHAESIEWEFNKASDTSGLDPSKYRLANEKFWKTYIVENKLKDLPVFACFHDSYPHVTATIGDKIQDKLNSGNPLPQNTAYYRWNDERNCSDLWVQYYTMQLTNFKLENEKGNKKYLDAVDQKMIDFSKSISNLINTEDIEIEKLEIEKRGKDYELIVVFKNGNRTPFVQLPQGYKRIFSIVFDIANRAYLLNSNCKPSGIVIIDEIELHLHPSIAQEILTALKETYPKLQFIISTHSPLVITNFKQDENNYIYKMYNEEGEYKNERIENLYGIDYNSGLRDWMDAPYRQSDINNLKESYNYWKSVADDEMITQVKKKIEKAAGKDSELYKSLN
ncbi:chromosome segregation protein SMC [Bacteroidia bacterium]|nr:chromosome segregation protein SMC [Bacteroidia bacterium]